MKRMRPSVETEAAGSDAIAVEQTLAGDRDAYRLLVERHSRNVFRLAYRMTGNQHDAEEVVQEAFLRAYQKLRQFESRANFGTWLYRIVANCSVDLMRAKQARHDQTRGDSLDEAIDHIHQYGSAHTDTIVTQNGERARRFLNEVDSAGVFWNASTRFSDGFRYGFGAEVGVSTNKTHARGPVGVEGLMIYKYQLIGNGHVVATYTGESARPFLHRKL